MPYEIPLPAIDTALRAVMVASTPLTALLSTKPTARGGGPAIYPDGEVYQGQTFPYLTIGAWTQVAAHRLSPGTDGYGWNCTVQIKAVGQKSEAQLFTIMSLVASLVPHGQSLAVTGYGSAWTDELNVQPTLKEIAAGVTTYALPAILRVYVQS